MDCFSLTISLATILSSCIVSIVTIVHQFKTNENNNKRLLEIEKINHENQIKLKHLDYYYSKKSTAVNEYLKNLYCYLNDTSAKNLLDYQISMSNASMYVSPNVCSQFQIIDWCIKNNKINQIKEDELESLIQVLNDEAQQYK